MAERTHNPEIQERFSGIVNGAIKASRFSLTVDAFVPAKGNLLVKAMPKDEITKGGIVLPENVSSEKGLSIVVKAWEGCDAYEPGDVVLTFVHAGHEIEVEDRPYRVLQTFGEFDGDILGHWPRECITA